MQNPVPVHTYHTDGLLLEKPKGKKRYVIVALCLWAVILLYVDRTNMGVAIYKFIEEKDEQGQILSAFYYGYLCTQLLGGVLSTKFGAKRVLMTGLLVWTLCDLSTIVFYECFGCLFAMRIGMGLGQGIIFPCLHQIAGAWYPKQERTRLVSFVSAGSDIGTIVSLTISPVILDLHGWQSIYITFSILSGIWFVFFFLFGASYPEEDGQISAEEQNFIIINRRNDVNRASTGLIGRRRSRTSSDDASHKHEVPWRQLFTQRAALAVYISHFCLNYGWYVLLSWIPQYFREELNVNLAKDGFKAAIPYICGYCGALLFGRLSDFLIAKGFKVLHVRQLMNGIASLGSACFLFLLRFASTPTSAVILLSLTLFCGRASVSGYWVNMVDIASTRAGLVMGVSNTIATIPGIVGNVVTGFILKSTENWDAVFLIASIILVFGGLVFQFNASDQNIFRQFQNENVQQDLEQPLKSPTASVAPSSSRDSSSILRRPQVLESD